MDTENTNDPDTELDAEGHRLKNRRIEEAGAEATDAEGHGVKRTRIDEAGADDVEGHRLPKR